ncbi:D-2-hydroxyacid dehydrogenase [Enterovibrio sp. 27052020O]|uniref:D-2-hydroxyacid dehydrogenase n=1 Tax=Enterovibrio sp. 27052020O TaxID=3241166 RepID=UPI00388FF391
MNQLYLCSEYQTLYLSLIEQANLPELTITSRIEDANLVLADPPKFAKHIEKAENLAWLQSTYAGCDALLAQDKRDYLLTNVRGIFGPLMSEYVFGQLFTLTRHLAHYRDAQSKKQWSVLPYESLINKKLVILGTGSIGAHVAGTAKHFGMKVTGISRSGQTTAPFDTVFTTSQLSVALSDADVIVSTLPSTSETQGLLNQHTLSACNKAILFNVGRGSVLDENALLVALEKGHIRHAVLDVFASEPLDENHPFWAHPAVTITPHISAVSFPEQVFAIFTENYRRWHEGNSLQYAVDFDLGY